MEVLETDLLSAREKDALRYRYGDEVATVQALVNGTSLEAQAFAQAENGVGAVRYLETLIAAGLAELPDMSGQRVLVCTGTAMRGLLPLVFPALERATGAAFELVSLTNSYFGPSVTTAGLLPGADFKAALVGGGRDGYDLALLPAESVNEDGIFVDDLPYVELEALAPMPIRLSYHFTDALAVALV